MKKLYLAGALAFGAIVTPSIAKAQLSQNPDKFLGNITTQGQVNTDGFEYADFWNQITPENESKWSSIEGSRDNYNWRGCDNCVNYAKEHGFPFKFHTLIWGSQYPSWMDNLSRSEQYQEIVEWMDAIKARYPDLELIDVVNEAIPGHAPAPYKDALGGDGATGYDWIIKAFEMAYERWPNAILIYNDYNTFQWQRNEFISLVKTLRDNGAPIDAYGCQSHDLTDISISNFKSAMDQIQNSLKMPMYSTEYDIGTPDDNKQLTQFKNQIPYMWEKDYFAGLTLWGWIYGKTWVTDGNSGIIKDGQDRPAMKWLREYMATDAAKNAKGPFPGGKKEASLYIKPSHPFATVNEEFEVIVRAALRPKTIEYTDFMDFYISIDHIDFYIDNELSQTLTEAPYIARFTPTGKRRYDFKAIMYDTEGNTYVRTGGVTAHAQRIPFNGEPMEVPGLIEMEDFDICGEGASYHDIDTKNEGGVKDYRDDNAGVDLVAGNGGVVVGHTAKGEWLEYTVNITKEGLYDFELVCSAGNDGAAVKLGFNEDGIISEITNEIKVPNTGSWDTYTTVKGKLKKKLSRGTKILRVMITGSYANLDKLTLICSKEGITDIEGDVIRTYEVYSPTGVKLGQITTTDDNVTSNVLQLTGNSGIYLLRDTLTGESTKVAVRY